MKFGTSGLRGLVSDLTDETCAAYAAAFVTHLGTTGEVLLGRDLRPSSPRIAAACAQGIRAAGADPVDCGVLPTPALALEAFRRGVPALMVTGSHIPFDRNGLKFYRPDGEITKSDETGIVAALGPPRLPPADMPAAMRSDAGASGRYLQRYVDFFGAGRLAGLRVGVWEHSAAGRDLTGETLRRLGAEVIGLGRTDTFVPIDTEAVAPEDADRIAGWIREHRLAALASTDGDGDRPLLADETGTVLRGDALGILTARAIGATAVAAPLNVSSALERSGWFARTARSRIGSPFVIEALEALATGAPGLAVGFEANGGFLLGGAATTADGRRLAPLPTRDALLPIVALLAAAARDARPLSALAADLPARVTASDRLQDVPEVPAAALLADLAAHAQARSALLAGLGTSETPPDTRDGVRMTLATGEIVHLRQSGNAPELRCYAEAGTAAAAQRLAAEILDRVRRRLS